MSDAELRHQLMDWHYTGFVPAIVSLYLWEQLEFNPDHFNLKSVSNEKAVERKTV